MPSGERIQFANNVNFIFECHSLQYASPATVSRCGMLLMSDQHNDIDNMLAAWLSTQPQDQAGEPYHPELLQIRCTYGPRPMLRANSINMTPLFDSWYTGM